MQPKTLEVIKIHPKATLPFRDTEFSAGLDLYSIESGVIYPKKHQMVRTGLRIILPPFTYGRIAPRSGLALYFGIDVMAGVIDSDYRGEVRVILINQGNTRFEYPAEMRIAQMIITPYIHLEPELIDEKKFLKHWTKRGVKGFDPLNDGYALAVKDEKEVIEKSEEEGEEEESEEDKQDYRLPELDQEGWIEIKSSELRNF